MIDIGADAQTVDQAIGEYWMWIDRYHQTLEGFYDDGDRSPSGIMLNFMGKWTMTFGPIAAEYGDDLRDDLDIWFEWLMDYYADIEDRDAQLDDHDAKVLIDEVMVAFDDLVYSASGGDADG